MSSVIPLINVQELLNNVRDRGGVKLTESLKILWMADPCGADFTTLSNQIGLEAVWFGSAFYCSNEVVAWRPKQVFFFKIRQQNIDERKGEKDFFLIIFFIKIFGQKKN